MSFSLTFNLVKASHVIKGVEICNSVIRLEDKELEYFKALMITSPNTFRQLLY